MTHFHEWFFDNWDFSRENVFESPQINTMFSPPPPSNSMLLLDGSNMLLLDGTPMLLL